MLKVVILSLLFMFLLSGTCQAQWKMEKATGEKLYSVVDANSRSLDHVISRLLDNVADLTPETQHSTFDKKLFLRLFAHSKYSKICPALHNTASAGFCIPEPDRPETITYYIYTLRKIVI